MKNAECITKDSVIRYLADPRQPRMEMLDGERWSYVLDMAEFDADGEILDSYGAYASDSYVEDLDDHWGYASREALYDHFEDPSNPDFIFLVDSFLDALEADGYEIARDSELEKEADEKADEAYRANLEKIESGNFSDLDKSDLSDADLSGKDLRKISLCNANLSGANLAGANLAGADLTCAVLLGTDLTGADLTGAVLDGASLCGAKLDSAILKQAKFKGSFLRGASMRECDATDADFTDADMRECDLCYMIFADASIQDADLRDCRVYEADFRGVFGMEDANLHDVDLGDAYTDSDDDD